MKKGRLFFFGHAEGVLLALAEGVLLARQKKQKTFTCLLLTAFVSFPAFAADWATPGNDQSGSYFSQLKTINTSNIGTLGFAWQYDLQTRRGQEATPLVINGTMYTSGTWGYVYALNAATGREVWRFDPHVAGQLGRNPCCDIVNRGAVIAGKIVYVASLDGVLHALNIANGHEIWHADTIIDHTKLYASTGAPQIAGANVLIGNAGGDMEHGGVRGYVSAYNRTTGALAWRFFTVPPAPGGKAEDAASQKAAASWSADRPANMLGGGTVWDGTAYDPASNLVYFGTGNAAPYDPRLLGNDQGDHLYTASIIALDASSGKLAWYYQTTPRDRWDFDAVQKFILADLNIAGASRQVIMQANKNGFFYVLDRKTGTLISAKDYTLVTWAKGVDPKTGRPILAAAGDYLTGPKNVYPSWAGGHSWPPMSFDPLTRLVYIPVIDAPSLWVDLQHNHAAVQYLDGFFTTDGIIPEDNYDPVSLSHLFGPVPDFKTLQAGRRGKLVRELLRAWDPVTQKIVWEQETSQDSRGYDGGEMSTAGGLVFQGRGDGYLCIYAAKTGVLLKKIFTGSHIMAAPSTYEIDGVQYVAVQVGYGGTAMATNVIPPKSAAISYENLNRILVFKLGGGDVPLPPKRVDPPFSQPPPQTADAASISRGEIKFTEQCSRCHMFGPSVTPDLRKLPPAVHAAFESIVLNGALASGGMGRFDDVLSKADVVDIHAYLIDQAWAGFRAQK